MLSLADIAVDSHCSLSRLALHSKIWCWSDSASRQDWWHHMCGHSSTQLFGSLAGPLFIFHGTPLSRPRLVLALYACCTQLAWTIAVIASGSAPSRLEQLYNSNTRPLEVINISIVHSYTTGKPRSHVYLIPPPTLTYTCLRYNYTHCVCE